MTNLDEQWKTAASIMWFVANKRPDETFAALFGKPPRAGDPWSTEWLERISRRDFGDIFGHLDFPHQLAFMNLATAAYHVEAQGSLGRAKAHHPGAAGNDAGSRPSPASQTQLIYGYPFGPDPKHPELSDLTQCLTCGQVVDVGGELRAHVADHQAEKYEALE